ncbi:MAG TPA: hypothetical protein VF837_00065 [Patescibacteria group bacterium]
MTSFFTTIPVAHALWNAPREMNLTLDWQANSGVPLQEMTVRFKDESLELAGTLGEKELTSKASNRASVVNQYLRDGGFGNIQLTDIGVLNRLYAAAILKLLGEFYEIGKVDYNLPIIHRPGFRLSKNAKVRHFNYGGQTVVEIPTKSNFSLLVTRPTGVNDFRMVEDWKSIIAGMKLSTGNGVILPMAQIDSAKIDVSSMKGLWSDSSQGIWQIEEALMAAKFALTRASVKFEAAFAYSAKCLGLDPEHAPEPGDYVADHALYFALAKPRYLLPLAVGLVDVTDLSMEKDLH